ncbi:MAG TPA: UbiA family prenyltransferase [Gemmatimonadaceae bacterium]|nr:UbiA family prenyltransferase [Gemmatimonadaceae bacterium]
MRWSDAPAWLALLRWPNALISAAGVVLGAWWAGARPSDRRTLLAAAAAAALTGVANAFNDYRDREIDRTAHPGRPLPRGRISPRGALAATAACAALGIGLAAAAVPALGVLSAAVVAAMLAYSVWLKPLGLPGNVLAAVLASLPFLYGAWSAGRPAAAAPLLLLAVPLHFAREVAKDIDDAAADAAGGRRTLPLSHGERAAGAAVVIALAFAAGVAAPLAAGRPRFAAFALPAAALFATAGRRSVTGRRGAPTLLKAGMLCAMAALVLAYGA